MPCLNLVPRLQGATVPNFTLNSSFKFGDGAYGPNYAFYTYVGNNAPSFSSSINLVNSTLPQQQPFTTLTVRIQAYISSSANTGITMTNYQTSFASMTVQPLGGTTGLQLP